MPALKVSETCTSQTTLPFAVEEALGIAGCSDASVEAELNADYNEAKHVMKQALRLASEVGARVNQLGTAPDSLNPMKMGAFL
jgi:hypothetical protein